MLTSIADTVTQYWKTGRKTRQSPSGWVSGNAPCCVHNGETADTRGRGGFIFNGNGAVSYKCFNCNYQANYVPGRHLNYKFRKLLGWIGIDENTVKRLVIDAIRIKELVGEPEGEDKQDTEVSYKPRPLPKNAISFVELQEFIVAQGRGYDIPPFIFNAITYVAERTRPEDSILDRYDFYVTDDPDHNLHKRVVIPCYWKNELIGYTSRAWDSGVKPKYHSEFDANYVFNVDKQKPENKFVIVVEGPFDAMAIDGVSILHNECNDTQADIIDSLGKEVIVVPDFDKVGRRWSGERLVDQAIEYGWSVSFPVWQEDCKDVSEAVKKYGRLFVLKSIIESKQSNKLKIELMKKRVR